MKYFFAVLILAFWLFFVTLLGWDVKISKAHNIFIGLELAMVLGVIYWVPFWLIFLR